MTTLHPCDKVGVEYVDTAPHRYSNTVELGITPEQLFEVFADADAWPRWAKVITGVTWTSPMPPTVGTTRDVTMRGGLVGSEEFLVWNPGTQMAFRFNEASEKSIRAFAERYDVVATPSGCRLTWTLALDVTGPGRHFMPLSGAVSNAAFRWFLRNLRRYTDERFAVGVR
ncbi:MAG TPA: SRPBCC family protein [Nocardioides sp.]|nr:SRPBCC family protein [Nocardioides sp.]